LIAPRPPRRDDPALFRAERAGDCDFPAIDIPEDLIPDLAMTVWSTVENALSRRRRRSHERASRARASDIPTERADAREPLLRFVFRRDVYTNVF
jgi:hypothetical protein